MSEPDAVQTITELCGEVVPYWTKHSSQEFLAVLEQRGFAVVPVEPTKAMLREAAKAMSPAKRPTPERVSCSEKHAIRYRAMIAAAPTPQAD